MKLLVYIIIYLFSILSAQPQLNVLLYNLKDNSVDLNDEVAVGLSNQISNQLIHLMQSDMSHIDEINFIPVDILEREKNFSHKILLDEIKTDFNNGFAGFISRDRVIEIIKKASNGNLAKSQMNSLVDSILFSISSVAKDITKEMMNINSIDTSPVSGLTVYDLFKFVNRETNEILKESTFSSLIASSHSEFNSDVVVVGNYSIMDNEITVKMYLYNYSTFSLIDTISAKSSMSKGHVLIKDLEFNLLKKLGVILENYDKEMLAKYNVDNFSKDSYSLYLSKLFNVSDIKEIQYRLQFPDDYDLEDKYYHSLFTGLMENDIKYKIKFHDLDNYFNVFSTESVNSSSVFIDVLRSTWHGKMGAYSNSDLSELKSTNSKMVIEVNFDHIEAIYFKKDGDPFVDLLKQIAIYGIVITSGFILSGIF